MPYSVFIDGGHGTTGLEIAERLAGRSDLDLIALDEADRRDNDRRRQALADADIAILCLPDDAAREAVALASGSSVRIIDASSAHRTHADWTYGFAELRPGQRAAIAGARHVSNPGCYPTGFIALIAPLVARGLLPADGDYAVNAVSGYSGGGKALVTRMQSAEPDLGYRAYGLDMDHKHVPEMRAHAGLSRTPLFAPAVIRAYRGMQVEVPLFLDTVGAAAGDLHTALAEHYADEALVTVAPFADAPGELLLHEGAAATDRLELHVLANASGTQARLIARLDNLGKGAGGAAVQNLNLMLGLDEQAGLRL